MISFKDFLLESSLQKNTKPKTPSKHKERLARDSKLKPTFKNLYLDQAIKAISDWVRTKKMKSTRLLRRNLWKFNSKYRRFAGRQGAAFLNSRLQISGTNSAFGINLSQPNRIRQGAHGGVSRPIHPQHRQPTGGTNH